MKLAVVGSRGWIDSNLMFLELSKIRGIKMIISGGAAGADTFAQKYAETWGVPILIIYPNYRKHGKPAPLRRNVDIVKQADKVIAFHDGKSRGTLYTINIAAKAGKLLKVVEGERIPAFCKGCKHLPNSTEARYCKMGVELRQNKRACKYKKGN